MRCLAVANGFKYKSGHLTDTAEVLLGPVGVAIHFAIYCTGDGASYSLKVNNTLVRDITPLSNGITGEYINGLLYPGETLTLSTIGAVSYRLEYISKEA